MTTKPISFKHNFKSATCPGCGYNYTDTFSICVDGSRMPKTNDLCICLGCTEVLSLNDDLTLRVVGIDEYMSLSVDVRSFLIKMRTVIVGIKEEMKKKGMT